jgi:hypothetical protein
MVRSSTARATSDASRLKRSAFSVDPLPKGRHGCADTAPDLETRPVSITSQDGALIKVAYTSRRVNQRGPAKRGSGSLIRRATKPRNKERVSAPRVTIVAASPLPALCQITIMHGMRHQHHSADVRCVRPQPLLSINDKRQRAGAQQLISFQQ